MVSSCWEEHVIHLGKLFGTLKEAGLTCKRGKCSFGRIRLEFLGHVVGGSVIKLGWRASTSKNQKAVESLLGVGGLLSKVHQGLSSLVLYSHALDVEECGWGGGMDKPDDGGLSWSVWSVKS